MEGNSAKKAPVLDHLVNTASKSVSPKVTPASKNQPSIAVGPTVIPKAKASVVTAPLPENNPPQNRRTDKSEFEIELTQIVNKLLLKHFSEVSEEIVSEVLKEVRSRLPGRRKD